jgi:hypothetical protein
MSSTNLNLSSIEYRDQLRSKPVSDNFTEIQNNFNSLRSEVYASLASTASEVTSARDGYDTLSENINARSLYGAGIATGGLVSAAAVPDNTVVISTGAGICPNGVGVEWDSATSNTIGVVTKPRYIVATINSSNVLSLELGATADDPTLPTLSSTQKALGGFLQSTASPVVINNSDIWDMRRQGATFNGRHYGKIQDAVSVANGTVTGTIDIGPGKYIEEVDLSGKSNLELNFQTDAKLYRPDDSSYAIKSVNGAGTEESNIKIIGADLYGNSKAGAIELAKFEYTDDVVLDRCKLDGNASSTATYKNILINQCDRVIKSNLFLKDGSGAIDQTTLGVTNSTYFSHGGLTYETPWIERSIWNSAQLGSNTTLNVNSNLTHNLGANITDLEVRVFLATDASGSNAQEMVRVWGEDVNTSASASSGWNAVYVDSNNIIIQVGIEGMHRIATTGLKGILLRLSTTPSFYYKVKVYSK